MTTTYPKGPPVFYQVVQAAPRRRVVDTCQCPALARQLADHYARVFPGRTYSTVQRSRR